jgi:hypothetical protein
MWILDWFSWKRERLHRTRSSRSARGRQVSCRLTVEPLEDRTMPAFLGPINTPGVAFEAVGDFNGDGRADLIFADYAGNSVSVRLSNGDGTFQSLKTSAAGVGPIQVVVGDFNGDGKLDAATLSEPSPWSFNVSVLLGNGDGAFQPPKTSGLVNGHFESVAVGDMNNDGRQDFVITRAVPAGRTVTAYCDVFLSRGDGSLKLNSSTQLLGGGNGLALGDFNGDHNLDVLTSDSTAAYLLLGTGKGTLRPATFAALVAGPLAVGDFNADGKLDFVTTTNNNVSVVLGNGNGTFGTPHVFAVGTSPDSVVVGDFNHDGKLDIVTANSGSGDVSLLLGKGDGTFQTAQSFAAGPGPVALVVGDFNGDGWLDLAVANHDSTTQTNSLSVLLNDRQW